MAENYRPIINDGGLGNLKDKSIKIPPEWLTAGKDIFNAFKDVTAILNKNNNAAPPHPADGLKDGGMGNFGTIPPKPQALKPTENEKTDTSGMMNWLTSGNIIKGIPNFIILIVGIIIVKYAFFSGSSKSFF